MEKIGYMPINKLRKMISSKEISPVEIMNETFERINSLNSRFGAYITLDQAGSLKKAKEAEEAGDAAKNFGGKLLLLYIIDTIIPNAELYNPASGNIL